MKKKTNLTYECPNCGCKDIFGELEDEEVKNNEK